MPCFLNFAFRACDHTSSGTFTFTCTSNVHVRKRQFYPLDSTKTQKYVQTGRYLDTSPPRRYLVEFALRARTITTLGALAKQFHEKCGLITTRGANASYAGSSLILEGACHTMPEPRREPILRSTPTVHSPSLPYSVAKLPTRNTGTNHFDIRYNEIILRSPCYRLWGGWNESGHLQSESR